MTQEQLHEYFQLIEDRFNEILCSNDSRKISTLLADEWILLNPEFGITPKQVFIEIISNGDLVHSSMGKKIMHVDLQDDIAIVITRGFNRGSYKGLDFDAEHWVTNIYRKIKDDWVSVMQQEMPVPKTC